MIKSKGDLIAFEERVKQAFLKGQIHAPVHLSGGNEDRLIEVFQEVHPGDWVLSTWRNHYHALLKGVPEEWLYEEILAGHSMYVQNAEHKFLTSSIVGGVLPIAVGLGMGIKRRAGTERIWCFVGDMAAETGIYTEAVRYARGHRLPIIFVTEDNGLSTNTPTHQVWYEDHLPPVSPGFRSERSYHYQRTFPHVGVGEWVTFG